MKHPKEIKVNAPREKHATRVSGPLACVTPNGTLWGKRHKRRSEWEPAHEHGVTWSDAQCRTWLTDGRLFQEDLLVEADESHSEREREGGERGRVSAREKATAQAHT